MSRITCNVITDLLELYADEVISDDTKQVVDEHLAGCISCNDKLIKIKQRINIPAEINIKPIKRIKRGIRKKNIIISVISILVVSAVLFGMYYFITQYKTVISYDKTHIYSIQQGDNDWEILVNFIDNIDSYTIQNKRIDDTAMEVYICFNDTYQTRYFSNRKPTNQYISVPAFEESSHIIDGITVEQTRHETVKIYYSIIKNGRIHGEKILIWEK